MQFLILRMLLLSLTLTPADTETVQSDEWMWDWQVVHLHPEGDGDANSQAGTGPIHGGYMEFYEGYIYNKHPVLWNGTSDDYIDLLPSWAQLGEINGMDGPQQGGYVWTDTDGYAALWSPASSEMQDLSPVGPYVLAEIAAIKDGQQVGNATFSEDGYFHACLWYSTPESFVDLHPSDAMWSEAFATDGTRQGGRVSLWGGGKHAVMWEGTSESYIDMNPEYAQWSRIDGMAGNSQVGHGLFDGGGHNRKTYAILWHGTPESAIIMNPTDGYASYLYATTGTIHAGSVNYTGWAEAGVWIGDDPDSFFNLHDLLPPDCFASGAGAIAIHKGRVYVSGGVLRSGGAGQAVVWIGRLVRTAEPVQ